MFAILQKYKNEYIVELVIVYLAFLMDNILLTVVGMQSGMNF